jgi:hypothetical protein
MAGREGGKHPSAGTNDRGVAIALPSGTKDVLAALGLSKATIDTMTFEQADLFLKEADRRGRRAAAIDKDPALATMTQAQRNELAKRDQEADHARLGFPNRRKTDPVRLGVAMPEMIGKVHKRFDLRPAPGTHGAGRSTGPDQGTPAHAAAASSEAERLSAAAHAAGTPDAHLAAANGHALAATSNRAAAVVVGKKGGGPGFANTASQHDEKATLHTRAATGRTPGALARRITTIADQVRAGAKTDKTQGDSFKRAVSQLLMSGVEPLGKLFKRYDLRPVPGGGGEGRRRGVRAPRVRPDGGAHQEAFASALDAHASSQDSSDSDQADVSDVFSRKPESWDEVTPFPAALVAATSKLPVYKEKAVVDMNDIGDDSDVSNQIGQYKTELPQYHVIQRDNGDKFVVDTQGYQYPRYVAKLPKSR